MVVALGCLFFGCKVVAIDGGGRIASGTHRSWIHESDELRTDYGPVSTDS